MTVSGITPATDALTTIDRVKQVGGKDDLTSDQNQAIQYFINAASRRVSMSIYREFILDPLQTNVRTFELDEGRYVWFGRGDARAISLVELDPDLSGSPPSIPSTSWRALPAEKPYGVYSAIQMVSNWGYRAPGMPRLVRVTGTWGWPIIPDDVALYTAVTVLDWLQMNQEVWSATFNLDTARLEVPHGLPAGVVEGLRMYAKPRIVG